MIFIFSGGSGGHLIPTIKLLDDLNLDSLLFVSRKKIDRKMMLNLKNNFKFLTLLIPKPKNVIFYFFSVIFWFLFILYLSILRKPRIFIGFGGYVTVPGMLVGIILKKKTFIYEPNIIPGKANLFLSKFITHIFYIWKSTPEFFHKSKAKFVKIKPLIDFYPIYSKEKKKFTFLITGGSHGSRFLNSIFLKTISLINKEIFNNIRVYWFSGEKDYRYTSEQIKKFNFDIKVYGFSNELRKIYSEVDFAFVRGGMQTLLELIYSLIPALIIPYPHAGGHQIENARKLYLKGCFLYLREEIVTPVLISQIIEKIYYDQEFLIKIRKNLSLLKERLDKSLNFSDFIKETYVRL
jgi:UDP-N-acetylglucosamine--N-acetylmuramyl-(pentapeptide) pyrophosphoryl-undecaprenol N-acetylglucosamine transferase